MHPAALSPGPSVRYRYETDHPVYRGREGRGVNVPASLTAGCYTFGLAPKWHMPRLIERPTVVAAAGNRPKQIQEFAGRVNSGHSGVSVARMVSPGGWQEPGQRPDFEEITVVLRGMLRVEHAGGAIDVSAGQAVVTAPGEWVRYSTPEESGAEYIAVCLPAFSPSTVHRDE
jgi:mannose-6-phosphate isomerase-like protein (cupin superfamily)